MSDSIEKLVKIGFSEYEAKAYLALLKKSPVTGYELSRLSGVPRSTIYEVLAKLTARGAAMALIRHGSTKYAPVPADEFLDQVQREHQALVDNLKDDLATHASTLDLEYVWNIEGQENILAKAEEMIGQAASRIYVCIQPATFPDFRPMLEQAIARGVRVAIYSTGELDLPGGQMVVAALSEEALSQAGGLGVILVVDGDQVLIGEWRDVAQARASWTSAPLLVFIAEHHLRTDIYLPRLLTMLGDQAREVIHEEDWELFARAMESHIEG